MRPLMTGQIQTDWNWSKDFSFNAKWLEDSNDVWIVN